MRTSPGPPRNIIAKPRGAERGSILVGGLVTVALALSLYVGVRELTTRTAQKARCQGHAVSQIGDTGSAAPSGCGGQHGALLSQIQGPPPSGKHSPAENDGRERSGTTAAPDSDPRELWRFDPRSPRAPEASPSLLVDERGLPRVKAGSDTAAALERFYHHYNERVRDGWAKRTPAERFLTVRSLTRDYLHDLGIPPPEVHWSDFGQLDSAGHVSGAEFREDDWTMSYNRHLFDTDDPDVIDLHDGRKSSLFTVIRHEMRHPEQYYRMEQYRRLEGKPSLFPAMTDVLSGEETRPGPEDLDDHIARAPMQRGSRDYIWAEHLNEHHTAESVYVQMRDVPYAERPLEQDAHAGERHGWNWRLAHEAGTTETSYPTGVAPLDSAPETEEDRRWKEWLRQRRAHE